MVYFSALKGYNLCMLTIYKSKIDFHMSHFFRILDYNFVQVIAKGWLYDLGKLKELSINNNKIYQVEIDAWEFCRDLSILYVLHILLNLSYTINKILYFSDLSSNRLKSIKRDTFKYLSMLKELNLNSNSISYIEENAFSHVPNLKTL